MLVDSHYLWEICCLREAFIERRTEGKSLVVAGSKEAGHWRQGKLECDVPNQDCQMPEHEHHQTRSGRTKGSCLDGRRTHSSTSKGQLSA